MSIHVYPSIITKQLTDLKIADTVAFLDDLGSSGHKNAPITSGLFRMGAGEALPYNYEFSEYKLLLEGEMTVTDDKGETYELKPGDMVFFPSGSRVKFSSRSSGLAFYVAQR
jgi:uncharacterized cupin superfamily protein